MRLRQLCIIIYNTVWRREARCAIDELGLGERLEGSLLEIGLLVENEEAHTIAAVRQAAACAAALPAGTEAIEEEQQEQQQGEEDINPEHLDEQGLVLNGERQLHAGNGEDPRGEGVDG